MKASIKIYMAIGAIAASAAALAPALADAATAPYVNTYQIPGGGVRVDMSLPSDYAGQVSTVYSGGKWETFSTTTPLTAADQAALEKQAQARFQVLQQLFADQQKLFDQQQQLMQSMFNASW
ncbi:MAG: hypothetical protein KGI69_00475 [Patescibacteria group bacterium]|nr:hypothetical protein [Patescibacteria group bacterium]